MNPQQKAMIHGEFGAQKAFSHQGTADRATKGKLKSGSTLATKQHPCSSPCLPKQLKNGSSFSTDRNPTIKGPSWRSGSMFRKTWVKLPQWRHCAVVYTVYILLVVESRATCVSWLSRKRGMHHCLFDILIARSRFPTVTNSLQMQPQQNRLFSRIGHPENAAFPKWMPCVSDPWTNFFFSAWNHLKSNAGRLCIMQSRRGRLVITWGSWLEVCGRICVAENHEKWSMVAGGWSSLACAK